MARAQIIWLVLLLGVWCFPAHAAKPHPCDGQWCMPGHFLGLDVSGTVSATHFVGDGSGITGVGGGSTPASPTTAVQWNNAGALGGSANFVFISSSQVVSVTNLSGTTIWGTRYQAQPRAGIAAPLSSTMALQSRIVSGTSQVETFTAGGVSATAGGELVMQLTSQTAIVSGSLQAARYKANILTGLAAPQ